MKFGNKKLKNDLAGVAIPLYMVLLGGLLVLGAVLVAFALGYLWSLVGIGLIIFGGVFALQILPPRGWPGIIIGLIPIGVGLAILAYARAVGAG